MRKREKRDRDDFRQAKETDKSLKLANDHAEWKVASIQEYSNLLIFDNSQLQFLLKLIEDIYQMYPDSKKKTV